MRPSLQEKEQISAMSSEATPYRILVMAGHSGGHLFPAVAFLEQFKFRFPGSVIRLMTSEKGRKLLTQNPFGLDRTYYLPNFPLPRALSIDLVSFFWNLIRSFFISSRILQEFRPQLCVGFGSYASYPGMMMGVWKKIPTLIHEQNQTLGAATRWLFPYVDRVALSFPPDSSGRDQRIFHVGLPIRNELRNAPKKTTGTEASFALLITGGSQGSGAINRAAVQAIALLRDEEKKKIVVNHITGEKDERWVFENYEKLGIRAKVFPFCRAMQVLYRETNMAITRAGSNTLFELATFGIPSVVIPYPFASGHQTANAKFFQRKGAVLLREEKDLTPDWLCEQIRLLFHNVEKRNLMSQAMSRISTPTAADLLVELAKSMI